MISKIEQQIKKKKHNNKRMKKQTQQGSGFFAELFGLEGNNKKDVVDESKMNEISRARRSETMFINSWENLHEATKKMKKSYENHINNLEILDNTFKIKGLTTTFKSVVIPNDINNKEEVDRTNPLLLRNYLISSEVTPVVARKEHLLKLARYVLKKFSMGDEFLVDKLNVKLSGITATYMIEMKTDDKFEIEIKVDDNYMIDINKFQKELVKVFKKIKDKLVFDIEVVEDFKLGEEPMQIPGLDFLDENDGIEKKLIGLHSSVKGENNSIKLLSNKSNKSSSNMNIFSIPKLPSENKSDRFAKDHSIGIQQGLNNIRELDKKPADVEDKLAKIMEGGPEGLIKVSSVDSSSNTSKSRHKHSKKKSYKRKFNSNKSEKKSKKKNAYDTKTVDPKQEKIDKMNKECNKYSNDKSKCNKTIGCFYNNKKEICHVNKNVLVDE